MNSGSRRSFFFKRHNFIIDPKNGWLQLPGLTVQLNQILPEKTNKKTLHEKNTEKAFVLTNKVPIAHQSQVLLPCSLKKVSDEFRSCVGLVTLIGHLEDKCSFALTSSFSKIDDNVKVFVSTEDISDNQFALNIHTEVTLFKFLKDAQVDNLVEIDNQFISVAEICNPDEIESELNQLPQKFTFQKIDTPTSCPNPDYSKLWFVTPQTCNDFFNLTRL